MYVYVAVPVVGSQVPGMIPKSGAECRVQRTVSEVVTSGSTLEVQLSDISTVSRVWAAYDPFTYSHMAILSSTASQEPSVTPKSAVALKIQRIVSLAVS